MEEFEKEARAILLAMEQADSLGQDSAFHTAPLIQDRVNIAPNPPFKGKALLPIDMNRADSADLLPLPGIGPVFSRRIIKYRDLLGGFHSADQLCEVYGLSEETLHQISEYVFIDTSAIKGIAINTATFRELLRHPYLQLEDVKSLVQYRDFKGEIDSFPEFRDNHILPDSTLNRILPYIVFR